MSKSDEKNAHDRAEAIIAAQKKLQTMIKVVLMTDQRALSNAAKGLSACRGVLSSMHAASGTVKDIERRVQACEAAIKANEEVQDLWLRIHELCTERKSKEQYERCVDEVAADVEASMGAFRQRFTDLSKRERRPECVISSDRAGHA